MELTMMKAKIHRATVTNADLHYEGSITVDPALLEASGILPYEMVDVLNIDNGQRFTTYTIEGSSPGNGEIQVNGAAARLVQKGDLVIICAYARMNPEEARTHVPTVILVDADNKPVETAPSAQAKRALPTN
jgi:aspartate 1-decarboxylase